ncbi:MAG: hypothetical protein WD355_00110 [Balneolaceae bacterium]
MQQPGKEIENQASAKLEEINQILLEKTSKISDPGLANGKMGICIYFYHLANSPGMENYSDIAEQLIDEVYQEVGKNRIQPDFEHGLAGIAWGIEYLVRHGFVEADTDQILSGVDDKIYLHLTTKEGSTSTNSRTVLGYMLYLLSRIEGKQRGASSIEDILFRRLLIEQINKLGETLEERNVNFREPRLFSIAWSLPLILLLLGRCHTLQIHTRKVERILEFLLPDIVSLFPRLTGHRLYLLFGMESVHRQLRLPGWEDHIDRLKNDLRLDDILERETWNKNIHFINGLAGISLMSRLFCKRTDNPGVLLDREIVLRRICESGYLDKKHDELEERLPGILSGLAGIALELLHLLQEEPVTNGM